MLNQKIIDAIKSQFTKERFLFWDDTEGQYLECIPQLAIDGVRLVMSDEAPALAKQVRDSDFETRKL